MGNRADCSGGGIWAAENMAEVARSGMTHIIDMQIEFDDTELAKPHDIQVLWNAIDDDFQPKPPEVFKRGVELPERLWTKRARNCSYTAPRECTGRR